ncbi:MAG: endopeptidase La [Chloroflexi bacterium]|nr:endopeptidase La [Chloroflexota bacterium]
MNFPDKDQDEALELAESTSQGDDEPQGEPEGESEIQPSDSRLVENVQNIQEVGKNTNQTIPEVLPILPLRNVVVYPLTFLPLSVGQPRSIKLVDDAALGDRIVGLVAMKDSSIEEPSPDDVYQVGTVALIHRLVKSPDGSIGLFVQGLERFRISEFVQQEPYLKARIQVLEDKIEDTLEMKALMRNTLELFQRLVSLVSYLPEELLQAASNIEDPRQLVYLVANSVRIDIIEAQRILELDAVRDKLMALNNLLTRELEVLELGKKIQTEAQSEMSKMQREFFLREQMKAIQRELGEGDEQTVEINELRQKVESAGMPPEAEREARRELDRLARLPAAAAEYGVIRTYLDWLISLPWSVSTKDNLDIAHARKVLDEDHYDLDEIKDRILEFLAVRKLSLERHNEALEGDDQPVRVTGAEGSKGAILCFIGPPGVGKTSLGQSIARALGREFIRMSLGGMHDEAEIRGHRRTYIGALPGRIVQGIRRAGTRNPVFMLDEIDKVGADFRGDPSSALLEVLDPAQNHDFRDHYLDVPFDLSQVMFIATGNMMETISPPLRDRMEILQLSGYAEEQKLVIVQRHLVDRQIKANSLSPAEISFEEAALRRIIQEYTREAGVRNLEREVGKVCRKVATAIAEGNTSHVTVRAEDVPQYLGSQRFYFEAAERTEIPGVATGMFYTPVGGDILFVEATSMPGHKGLTITGQLGSVMKESAMAALSYVRSKAAMLGINPDFYSKTDIHLHVPAGAVPKDGPSAGVTMATALVSLLTGRPVKSNVAMTGEITLRGLVLPVGGIKEKVLGAHRAELDTIILPRRNAKDVEELPENVRKDLKFIFAETIDEVLAAALQEKPVREPIEPIASSPEHEPERETGGHVIVVSNDAEGQPLEPAYSDPGSQGE